MEEKWTVEGACQAEPRSAVAFGAHAASARPAENRFR